MSESVNEITIKDPVLTEYHHESDEDAANMSNDAISMHLDYKEKDFYDYNDSHWSSIIDGVRYWIPDVHGGEKPVKGIVFESFEDTKNMYKGYAHKAGFVPRLSTVRRNNNGDVTQRYIVCNKSGKPENYKAHTLFGSYEAFSEIRRNITVTNCSACVKFEAIPGTSSYRLLEFVEPHNHQLLEEENRDLRRTRQKLQRHKQLMSNLKFRRDMTDFVGEADAQMLIDRLNKAKQRLPNFSFDYQVVNKVLGSLFWADEIAKVNYDVFGDVVSLGVTYGTNRYKMIFVTFTGFDHHKNCVIFGGGLLSSETTEAYNWLLLSFLKAHVKQPKLVLTDDDDDIKEAIALTLPQSEHRLGMWHILDRLPFEICEDILENTDFGNRLHKLVTNTYLLPAEFEESWHKLIAECKLEENKWLYDMFEIRERWIPSYFKAIPMCSIMNITSRDESFFKAYSNRNNSLLHFIICFENALETQRLNQRQLDHVTNTSTPMWMTDLPIERYAANVYTRTLFTEVQKEIWTGGFSFSCIQRSETPEKGCAVHLISEKPTFEFKVVRNLEDNTVVCSCLNFVRVGYLCRHIFYVLRLLGIDEISDQYVLRRWKRDALPADILKKEPRFGSVNDESDGSMTKALRVCGLT